MSRLYSDAMDGFPPLCNLLCRSSRQRSRSLRRNIARLRRRRRQRSALSGWRSAVGAGLARGDARPAQIRLPCHAEGTAGAGTGQDRSRASRRLQNLCRHASAYPGDPAGRRFHQRLYRGRARRAVGRTGTACRGLRARIRFVPRAAHAGGPDTAQSRRPDAEAARLSRSTSDIPTCWKTSASI